MDLYELSKLISKHIQGETSEYEETILQQWRQESPENEELFNRLVETERLEQGLSYFDSLDVDSSWETVRRKRLVERAKKLAKYVGYAAMIAGIMFSVFLFLPDSSQKQHFAQIEPVRLNKNDLVRQDQARLVLSNGEVISLDTSFKTISLEQGGAFLSDSGGLRYLKESIVAKGNPEYYHTLIIPKAGTHRIILADGTKVWLNALSTLKFPVSFSENNRKVYLTGEAYFEVAKDQTKPFLVEVSNSIVEVLGTHFNINSYDTEWRATLFEGSIKVRNQHGSEFLSPGQEANIVGDKIEISKANIKKATAWRNEEFYFENEPMYNILMELSRWYDFEIVHDGQNDDGKHYSGSIRRTLELPKVLKVLNSLSGYQFRVDSGELRYN